MGLLPHSFSRRAPASTALVGILADGEQRADHSGGTAAELHGLPLNRCLKIFRASVYARRDIVSNRRRRSITPNGPFAKCPVMRLIEFTVSIDQY